MWIWGDWWLVELGIWDGMGFVILHPVNSFFSFPQFLFPFLSLFFSPNTPKPPLPLFVSEDNPNSLAGKKKFRVFFSGKRMVTPENNTNWLFDYGLMDDIPVPDANFSVPNPAFTWPVQALNGSSSVRYLLSSSLPLSILGFCPIFFDWGSVSCYQFRALFVFGFSWFVLEFVV